MKEFGNVGFAAYILLLIGGIVLGLFGLFHVMFLGSGFIGRIIYIVIGAAAGYIIYLQFIKKKPV